MRKFTIGVGETISRNGRPASFGLDLACWPREWKPDEGRELGVGRLGAGQDTLASGQSLTSGQSIQSPSGRGTLTMQPDGNLVLYDTQAQPRRALWASNTSGGTAATMQPDGNLVVTDGSHKPLWASGTSTPGATARLQDDGNFVVYAGTNPVWSSSTVNWTTPPVHRGGFHLNVGNLVRDVGKVTSSAEKLAGQGVTDAGKFAAKAASSAVRIAGESVTDPKKFLHDIEHIATDATKIYKFVLEETAGLISLVPGLGTAISTAIAAGLAVIEGGGALEIAIKTAYGAIPIPPGIKFFTDLVLGAVLDLVTAVAKGGDLTKILERLIAEELAKALPDNVRSAGTTMLTALTPTVLAAITGKIPSVASVTAAVPGLPAIPPIPSVSGLPALPSAITAALPSLPGGVSIPGVTGVLGDKVDDFVTQLKTQYAALNLPNDVKKETDPIFNALVSMVHSMDVGPAILLAVRTAVSSKLPAGAVRDVGMRVFDTLAHLILGKLFHHTAPTQAKTDTKLTKAQVTDLHLAAARGQALPAGVTPVPNTVAAYQPLATAEQAKGDTKVTISIPPGGYVYGPYPQTTNGNTTPINPATAAGPPPIPAVSASAPAGTTAGVGAAQIEETIPEGWKLWTESKVPPELTKFAMAVRDKINSYPYGSIAETTTDALGRTIGAWKSHHTWTYMLQPDGTRKLTTGLWIPGVSLVIKQPDVGTSRGGGGGGGHGGGGGGGRGGWGGGGRTAFRGGWGGRGGYGRGGWGWGGGGGPWWPYVLATVNDTACANWGNPIQFPPEISGAVRATLSGSGWAPVAVRGSDGGLYLLSLDGRRQIIVQPCVAVGVGSADDDILKAMALDLLSSLRRGVPQGATRPVKAFAQAWNVASADSQISTDGKYTQETAAALNAALSALSPASGAAPPAVL